MNTAPHSSPKARILMHEMMKEYLSFPTKASYCHSEFGGVQK